MLKNMKKIIMPVLLSAFFFGAFSTVLEYNEPTIVYAAQEGSSASAEGGEDEGLGLGNIQDMPTFSMDGGTLNLGTLGDAEKTDFFNTVFIEYRQIVMFISGIGTISMILFFIINFINLGKSQGNPQERQKAVSGLIIAGIATAGLGSVTLIVALFFNAL